MKYYLTTIATFASYLGVFYLLGNDFVRGEKLVTAVLYGASFSAIMAFFVFAFSPSEK